MGILKRILIGIGIVVALMIAWYLVAVFWQGSSKPILAVADKFRPPSSWHLVSEDVEPPKIICDSIDVQCPRVVRAWGGGKKMSKAEFINMLGSSGWLDSTDLVCNERDDTYISYCSIDIIDGDYRVMLSYTDREDKPGEPSIDLLIYGYKR